MQVRAWATVLGVLAGSSVLAGGFKPANKVRVYCTSANSGSGLVHPEVSDSLRDLRQSVSKKQDWLQLVERAEDAHVTLEVEDRAFEATGAMETKYNDSTKTMESKQKHDYVVRVRMISGDFRSVVVGSCSGEALWGGWRCATGDIASQVEKFAQRNYERLMAPAAGLAPAAAPVAAPPHAAAAQPAAYAAPAAEVLTNASVISMTAAGLGDAIIVQKIRTSPTRFDTSTDRLIALRKAGVSEKVMAAVLDAK
jgi:hypothetical protein